MDVPVPPPELYGFVELDVVADTTQSFNDQAGSTPIARPGTYAGEHPRLTMSAAHSRLGLRWASSEENGAERSDRYLRAAAAVEVDFLGVLPQEAAEATVFTAPAMRLRQAWFRLETPIVDVTIGQTWQLFGWQPSYFVNTVEIQGVPGEVYSRAAQLRLSHVFASEAVDFEVAAAAARPPQRDAAVPDVQAGARLMLNRWKGLHTKAATATAIDPASLGVTGAVRRFAVANFSAQPTRAVTDTGWAFSANLFVPIVPVSNDDRANALSLISSYAVGAADADFYTTLNGGITFPPLPNLTGASPAPTYIPNVENGLVAFTPDGSLEAIRWWSVIVGLTYHFPPSGRVWISGNYSHLQSGNIVRLGNPSAVYYLTNWFDGNLFWDLTAAVRLGAEYAWFWQTYGDDVSAINSRFQVSAFWIF